MANTYVKINSVTVGSSGSNEISFNNIPQTYSDLKIIVSSRRTAANVWGTYLLKFNSDSTNSYTWREIKGDGATASATENIFTNSIKVGEGVGSGSGINIFDNTEIDIPQYCSNVNYKQTNVLSSGENNATTAYQGVWVGRWHSYSPITSISLISGSENFSQYSTFTLYGVFNADVSSAPATPTIGTATASGLGANVTFTGVNNAASYVMTSSPGSITATGTTSPIYVSGLADNTNYTFTVKSQNPFGLSSVSASSNSITTTTAGWENLGSYTSTTPYVEFSSIPSTYQHLAILYSIRTDQAGGGANESLWLRLNSLAGTNYGEMNITASPANGVNSSQGINQDSWGAFATAGAGTAAGTFGVGIIYLYNYADSNIKKSYSTQNGYYDNAGQYWQNYASGVTNLTNAVNTIRLQSGNYRTWASGSRISLYGIRG